MLPLAQMAEQVLRTADGREKTALSREYAAKWQAARADGAVPEIGTATPPDHPARPAAPELLSPRDVPRRRPGSPQGRIALLHAVAHIELNAVDLHWDIIARFAHQRIVTVTRRNHIVLRTAHQLVITRRICQVDRAAWQICRHLRHRLWRLHWQHRRGGIGLLRHRPAVARNKLDIVDSTMLRCRRRTVFIAFNAKEFSLLHIHVRQKPGRKRLLIGETTA